VFVQAGAQQYAHLWSLDPTTGSIRFRVSYVNQWWSYLSPVVVGHSVFMGGGYGPGMYDMSTADGAERWYVPLDMSDRFTPAVRGGLVYGYTAYQRHRLTVVDSATGAIAYEIADPNGVGWSYHLEGAPALGSLDDAIVTQGGRVVVFDLVNRRVKWEFAGQIALGVAVANGVVYVQRNGKLTAFRESDGAELWSWADDMYGRVGTPVVTDNVAFVSTESRTYAIDLRTHQKVWTADVSGSLSITKGGLLLIAQPYGSLIAYDIK
jgi:outer membrane protein assembly factor BamB